MLVHYLAPLKLGMVEVDQCVFEFGGVVQELGLRDLPVLSNSPLLLLLGLLALVNVLVLHFGHDGSGLLVVKIGEVVVLFSEFLVAGLFLPLLLLLHDDLVADHLLRDDVLQNVSQESVLHLNYIMIKYIVQIEF